jgi:hypothetical protein
MPPGCYSALCIRLMLLGVRFVMLVGVAALLMLIVLHCIALLSHDHKSSQHYNCKLALRAVLAPRCATWRLLARSTAVPLLQPSCKAADQAWRRRLLADS